MATYQFDTITPEQALAIQATDTVIGGDYTPGPQITYLPATATDPERVQVTMGFGSFEHTVVFGANIVQLSVEGRFTIPNLGKLKIGGAGDETLSGVGADSVFGGGGDDNLNGPNVFGGAGGDTLQGVHMSGDGGDDLFLNPTAGDYIDGGDGNDTIIFDGNYADYRLSFQGGSFHAFNAANGDPEFHGVVQFGNVETIRFDDASFSTANRLSITTTLSNVNEGAEGETAAHTFLVTRAGDLSEPLTVAWLATSAYGSDFPSGDSAHGLITIAAGQANASLTIYTLGDNLPEANESFQVTLDAGEYWLLTGGYATGTVIADDPGLYPILRVSPNSGLETDSGSTAINFTVTRSGDTSTACEATYQVFRGDINPAEGADFVGGVFPTGTVSFAPGETTKTITINVAGDLEYEGDESFTVALLHPTGNAAIESHGGGRITENDPEPGAGGSNPANTLAIARNEAPLSEGHSGVTPYAFTVTRAGNTSQAASVSYAVTGSGDHPADAADFQGGVLPSGTVNFAAGETSKTITVNVRGDATVESDEEFTVTLSNVTGTGAVISTVQAKAVILNDEADQPPSGGGSGGGGSSTPPPSSAPEEPRLVGDAGPDTIQGTSGDDTINAGDGVSYLRGGEGNDVIAGGRDFDDINGNQGADTASGGDGDDWVVGGKDGDFLTGDNGDDIVYGNLGDDVCEGDDGKDLVRGGQGNDVVKGGAGDDWLSGDRGDDTVTGGTGADIFHSFGDAGIDRVLDFNRAEGDRVQLDPGTVYTISQVGADTVIDMQGGGQVILVGVAQSSLTGDWIFVG